MTERQDREQVLRQISRLGDELQELKVRRQVHVERITLARKMSDELAREIDDKTRAQLDLVKTLNG